MPVWPPGGVDASPYRFGDLLALARRSWVRQVRARVEDAGFPDYRQTDTAVLRFLVRRPWPIGQLGDALGVTRQSARQLADGMVERGYARLTTDPTDARRTLVVLTAGGHDYGRAVAAVQDALNEEMGQRVPERDLAIADSVLRTVFETAGPPAG